MLESQSCDVFFFFFSSRRRHTRLTCDWSSDVCSSDLPAGMSGRRVLETISASKDVDGFHLYNVGGLVIGDTVFPPCTPYGVQKLLEHEGIELEGKNVVVVGASN